MATANPVSKPNPGNAVNIKVASVSTITQDHEAEQNPPEPAKTVAKTEVKAEPKAQTFTITKPSKAERYLKMLTYGEFGVGKTTYACTASEDPGLCDVVFINAESGDMSIEDFDVDLINVRSYPTMARVHEYLRLHCQLRDEGDDGKLRILEAKFRGVDVSEIDKPKKYRTVIIDSLSEIQKYCMYMLLGITVGSRPLDTVPDSPEFKEWGQSAEMIRLLVRTFRDLPMNVIFVCSEIVDEDERKQKFRRPNLSGKLSWEVQGFLDVVGYLTMAPPGENEDEPQRRLYIQPGKTFQAKNRLRTSERYLVSPTVRGLLDLKKGVK